MSRTRPRSSSVALRTENKVKRYAARVSTPRLARVEDSTANRPASAKRTMNTWTQRTLLPTVITSFSGTILAPVDVVCELNAQRKQELRLWPGAREEER